MLKMLKKATVLFLAVCLIALSGCSDNSANSSADSNNISPLANHVLKEQNTNKTQNTSAIPDLPTFVWD